MHSLRKEGTNRNWFLPRPLFAPWPGICAQREDTSSKDHNCAGDNHCIMHITAITVAALIVRLFLVNGPLQAQAAQCETVNSFADLARIVNLGMTQQRAEICFRPFHLAKPAGSTLVLNRPISLRCEKLQSDDKCTLEGGANHITIAGGNAKVTIEGFTFTGATQSAVRVMQTSRESHSLSGCEFVK